MKKIVSMLLCVSMIFTMLPVTAIAEEIENIGCTHHLFHNDECGYSEGTEEVPCAHECSEECAEDCQHEHGEECGYVPAVLGTECTFHCEKCEADVIYSEEVFYFSSDEALFAEDGGSRKITLFRERAAKETSVTVKVYDNSANYGEDYRILMNGKEVEKIEGATSIYNAFRDNGESVSSLQTDYSVTYGTSLLEEAGTANEDVNAKDMLSMFDELGVCAAEISVNFEKGQQFVELVIEPIDDEESEYDETFLFAVIDENGEAVETAQQVFGIEDNEEDPVVTVRFASEDKVVMDEESGTATLSFKREGNLAESTVVILCLNGEAIGYANFSPWQEEQTAFVGIPGEYTICDADGNLFEERAVTVVSSDSTETTVASGADPVLDAVPEAYATITEKPLRASTPDWFPEWAKGGSYETETEIVVMGSATSDNLFEKGGRTSKGGVTMFNGGNNEHKIYTSGTGSHYHNGYNFIDTIGYYDMTGIASITGRGHVTGVDYNADLMLGTGSGNRKTTRVESDQVVDLEVEVSFLDQSSRYIYYGNSDPQDKGGGTSFYVPNGFKMNKRPYTFVIDSSKITPVTFYGDDLHGASGYVPSFDGYTTRSVRYIHTEKDVKVTIVYEKEDSYPVKLVGYKLYNDKTKAMSETIELSGNTFSFNRDFLKKYEKTYCWKGDAGQDGTTDYIFTIIPVFEKIEVSYEIIQGEGNLILENPDGKLYRGDYAVFKEDAASDRVLAGIYHEVRTDTSSIPYDRSTTWGENGKVRVKLDNRATKHTFEPTYDPNATSLYVRYGEGSVLVDMETGNRIPVNGRFNGEEGLYLDKNAYSVNDYVTLSAAADDGYITRWTAGFETYYGDVLYYQLDGISEHNEIIVDFIPASSLNIITTDISGTVFYNYVTLESNLSVPIYLSNTKVTVTGDTYTKLVADGVVSAKAGGFIGTIWSGNQPCSVKNSAYFGNITAKTAGTVAGYNGNQKGNTTYFTNIYYCEADGIGYLGDSHTGKIVAKQTEAKTAEQFANGEVADLLNGGNSEATWKQEGDLPDFTGFDEPEITDGVYKIGSLSELMWFAEKINANEITSHKAVLTADITIDNSVVWKPISLKDGSPSEFDGAGHTITFANTREESSFGLFGNYNYSVIKNLYIAGSIETKTNGNIGVLVNSAYRTTIRKVISTCDITNYGTGNTGGLAGKFGGGSNSAAGQYSLIENCAVYANVSAGGREVTANIYEATTNEKGKYTITGFEGVSGGKYTVAVPYNNGIGYATITLGNKNTYNIELPQFATGNSYPYDITVGINGDFNSNIVMLKANQNISITLDVHSPSFDCSPVSVDFYFYASDAEGEKAAEAIKQTETLEAPSRTNGEHTYWDLIIPVDENLDYTRLYVRINSEKLVNVYDENGKFTGTDKLPIDSGLVDTGYAFINELVDTSIPVVYDVPEFGGAGNAPSVDIDSLKIPFIGNTDVSLTSKTGGYFVQRTEPDTGVTYLICGYSFDGLYSTGSIQDKYANAKKANEKAYAKYDSRETRPAGSSETALNTTTPEGGNGGNNDGGKLKKLGITFAPAFMFKYVIQPGEENPDKTFITGYELVLGLDFYYFKNIPFAIYGMPFFVSFAVNVEGVMEVALTMKNDKIDLAGELTKLVLGTDTEKENEIYESVEVMAGFPKLSITGKGGIGANGFLSMFVDMTINMPIMFQLDPSFDVGGKFGFKIRGGADMVIFTGTVDFFGAEFKYGNMDIVNDLVTVQQMQNVATASTMRTFDRSTGANSINSLEDFNNIDIEEALNNMTFAIADRSHNNIRRAAAENSVIADESFKNTGIQLYEFEDGSIVAFYLVDNGAESVNYLSAAYSVSRDGGKTWENEQFVYDNTGFENSSIQYDVNVFELEDRVLVTWSEADFEKLISEMNIDKDNITAAQIAKLMGAMNLKGRFFDKVTGEPIGEAFTVAENSTVACGVLDAVQVGEYVYIYYQRNAVPDNEDITFEELISMERTIALAKANVNDEQNWESSAVRVENENGQQYRIAEVEPFSYNGILGEIIVLDRNGMLAIYDASSDTWEPSNDDRQLYLRVYSVDEETGTISSEYLEAITEISDNAESPRVVSDDDSVYLFFNRNGNLVYLENFVATENDAEEIKEYNAFVIKNNDGTYTENNVLEDNATQIASHGTLNLGKTFSVSMSDGGTILLSWISDEFKREEGIPTEEIYGVMLKKVSNAEALRLGGIETEIVGSEEVFQLWAVGNPVALTDENGVIGALESICTDEEKGEFLLAYTRLNSDVRSEATSADIKAITTSNKPDVYISDVFGDEYPMPGSEATLYVEVSNEGFKPLNGAVITVSGIGEGVVFETGDTVWPGTSKVYELKYTVPESFDKTTDLCIEVFGTGEQAAYGDKDYFTVNYDAYFIIVDTWQRSIAGTRDDKVEVTVMNIGNKEGSPKIHFRNSIFGVEDEAKEYDFSFEETVMPGEGKTFVCLLTDTYINKEQTARIIISTGEGADQSVQKFMPKPLEINVDEDGDVTVTPEGDHSHEHEWSDWVTVNGVKSRECSACGIVEKVYTAETGKTEGEENPETGAVIIVFEKSLVRYIEETKVFGKKRKADK